MTNPTGQPNDRADQSAENQTDKQANTYEVWVPFALTYKEHTSGHVLVSIDGPTEGAPYTVWNGDIWTTGPTDQQSGWGTDPALSIEATAEATKAARALKWFHDLAATDEHEPVSGADLVQSAFDFIDNLNIGNHSNVEDH